MHHRQIFLHHPSSTFSKFSSSLHLEYGLKYGLNKFHDQSVAVLLHVPLGSEWLLTGLCLRKTTNCAAHHQSLTY